MLTALARLFAPIPDEPSGAPVAVDRHHACRTASAALLVEMSRADYEVTPIERNAIETALRQVFDLDAATAAGLLRRAEEHADAATSLYEFTRLINHYFQPAEKEQLIELLWFVAFVDGRLDKYEEHLVRRIAGLVYVSHAAFIRTKHRARERCRGEYSGDVD